MLELKCKYSDIPLYLCTCICAFANVLQSLELKCNQNDIPHCFNSNSPFASEIESNKFHSFRNRPEFSGVFGVMGVMAAAAAADSGLQPAGKQLIFERLHFENQCNFTQI